MTANRKSGSATEALKDYQAPCAVAFDDYTPETVEVACLAAARGNVVRAITDNELSPVIGVASHVLYVTEARLGSFQIAGVGAGGLPGHYRQFGTAAGPADTNRPSGENEKGSQKTKIEK